MSEHREFTPDWLLTHDPTATPAIAAARGRVLGLLADLSGAIADLEGTARATPPPDPGQVAALTRALAAAEAEDAGPLPTREQWLELAGAVDRLRATIRELRRVAAADADTLPANPVLDRLHEDVGHAWLTIAAVERRRQGGGL